MIRDATPADAPAAVPDLPADRRRWPRRDCPARRRRPARRGLRGALPARAASRGRRWRSTRADPPWGTCWGLRTPRRSRPRARTRGGPRCGPGTRWTQVMPAGCGLPADQALVETIHAPHVPDADLVAATPPTCTSTCCPQAQGQGLGRALIDWLLGRPGRTRRPGRAPRRGSAQHLGDRVLRAPRVHPLGVGSGHGDAGASARVTLRAGGTTLRPVTGRAAGRPGAQSGRGQLGFVLVPLRADDRPGGPRRARARGPLGQPDRHVADRGAGSPGKCRGVRPDDPRRQPGERTRLARRRRRLTAAGVRCREVTTTEGPRVMVWAEDVARARAVLDSPR